MKQIEYKERFELSYIHEEYGTTHGRVMFDGVELMDFWLNLTTGERAIKYTDSEEIIGTKIGNPLPETPLEQKSPKQVLVEKYVKLIGDLPGGIPGGIFKNETFDPVYFSFEVFSRYGDANHITRCILAGLRENEMVFWGLDGSAGAQAKYFSKDNVDGISNFEMDSDWYPVYDPSSFNKVFDEVFEILSEPLQPSRSRRFKLGDEMKVGRLENAEKPDILTILINTRERLEQRQMETAP